jgi:transposase
MPEPNDNFSMTVGNKVIVDAVFRDTGLDAFLDGLKRNQGESVSNEIKALVANSIEMTGISVNRLDRLMENPHFRTEYGLGGGAARSVYRTVERVGEHSDEIVQFLGRRLKQSYGVGMDTVFIDWTSMYFEAPQNDFVRVGYSRDHRPDRPQVTAGLAMDRDSGMPIGLTVNPGNIMDVTHFDESFRQIRPLLRKDSMIVFDNGAYSRDNARMLDDSGLGFVTRLQLNASDDAFAKMHRDDWVRIDGNISYLFREGNLKRRRFMYMNEKLKADIFYRYRCKAEHDYDEMEEMKLALRDGKKPRKKYRNSNCFVDTRLSYQFPLIGRTREEAIEEAVKRMTTGREGLFVLVTNRPLTAEETLRYYRDRNAVETAFRDLKHGIDWRPARCTKEESIKGRILISFLALFCMSMIRFLYPRFRSKTAESISEELSSFTLTVFTKRNGEERRVWSNFGPILRAIFGRERAVPVPKAPGQTLLDGFRSSQNGN